MRWPKYWSFSFSINPSSEHPGLISFRLDRLDLLAVQGTLKSLLQHHSSKASILHLSTFLTVQLSHSYMTTGKTIALTRRTFLETYKTSLWECVLLFLFMKPVVLLFTLSVLFLEPGKARHKLKSWKETPGAKGTADMSILSGLAQQP